MLDHFLKVVVQSYRSLQLAGGMGSRVELVLELAAYILVRRVAEERRARTSGAAMAVAAPLGCAGRRHRATSGGEITAPLHLG